MKTYKCPLMNSSRSGPSKNHRQLSTRWQRWSRRLLRCNFILSYTYLISFVWLAVRSPYYSTLRYSNFFCTNLVDMGGNMNISTWALHRRLRISRPSCLISCKYRLFKSSFAFKFEDVIKLTNCGWKEVIKLHPTSTLSDSYPPSSALLWSYFSVRDPSVSKRGMQHFGLFFTDDNLLTRRICSSLLL